jgi:pyruvate,water dikinase
LSAYVIPFTELGMHDVERVGGKNASLGEMISHLSRLGVKVPPGFATTADAFREFLAHGGLDARITKELSSLNVDDVEALARSGERIRGWVLETPFPAALEKALVSSWEAMDGPNIAVAVRSSATAEDLPDASFAARRICCVPPTRCLPPSSMIGRSPIACTRVLITRASRSRPASS